MKASVTICLAVLFVVAGFAQHSHSGTSDEQGMHSHHPTNDAEGVPGAVSGYLRDIACLLRNPKAGAATSAPTQDCLEKCVRGGSPLGVLTEEGLLFIPISKDSPDTSVHSQLLPYAGKYVRISGKVFERGGLHAIAIDKIETIDRPGDSKIPTL